MRLLALSVSLRLARGTGFAQALGRKKTAASRRSRPPATRSYFSEPLPAATTAPVATAGSALAGSGVNSALAWSFAFVGLFLATGGSVVFLYRQVAADRRTVEAMPILEGNPIVFLDISDNDEPVGRLVFQLRADKAPRAAANFLALCLHTAGFGYRHSPLYGGEPRARIFGGDFYGSGSGGYSVYGDTFPSEDLSSLLHVGPGTLSMRSYGPDTNNSQFFVSLRRLPEHDGLSQVVGYLVEGFEVLYAMDKALESSGRFKSQHDFRVRSCGELARYRKPIAADAPSAGDVLLCGPRDSSTEGLQPR